MRRHRDMEHAAEPPLLTSGDVAGRTSFNREILQSGCRPRPVSGFSTRLFIFLWYGSTLLVLEESSAQ